MCAIVLLLCVHFDVYYSHRTVRQLDGDKVPKEPGFRIGGRTFVGNGIVFRGQELVCSQNISGLIKVWKLDYMTDIKPEDYADLEILTYKEVSYLKSVEYQQQFDHSITGHKKSGFMERREQTSCC